MHAKASHARWDEEVHLLRAEGERVGKTFRYLENTWRKRQAAALEATTCSINIGHGAAAFAHRQMLAVQRLAEIAENHYNMLVLESNRAT